MPQFLFQHILQMLHLHEEPHIFLCALPVNATQKIEWNTLSEVHLQSSEMKPS